MPTPACNIDTDTPPHTKCTNCTRKDERNLSKAAQNGQPLYERFETNMGCVILYNTQFVHWKYVMWCTNYWEKRITGVNLLNRYLQAKSTSLLVIILKLLHNCVFLYWNMMINFVSCAIQDLLKTSIRIEYHAFFLTCNLGKPEGAQLTIERQVYQKVISYLKKTVQNSWI